MSEGLLEATPERRGLPLHSATLLLGQRPLETRHGLFTLHVFRDLATARLGMLLALGDLTARSPLLTRVHSSCLTSECLMGCDCDCAEQLEGALERIAEVGRGALVYLMQEGRGAGLSAKARDRMLVQASGNRLTTFDAYAEMGLASDLRRYDAVASMLSMSGVRGPLRLLTNNPEKLVALVRVLEPEKIEIEGTVELAGRRSPWNRDYLRAKRSSGHRLARLDHAPGERPPEPVRVFEPVVHEQDPERLVTASYFIPIALPTGDRREASATSVAWFRSTVLVERGSGREAIVLSCGDSGPPEATRLPSESEWIPLSLLDRLPVAEARGRAALARALHTIRERGTGRVGVVWDETSLEPANALARVQSSPPRSSHGPD